MAKQRGRSSINMLTRPALGTCQKTRGKPIHLALQNIICSRMMERGVKTVQFPAYRTTNNIIGPSKEEQ